jgi:hypothetical protein
MAKQLTVNNIAHFFAQTEVVAVISLKQNTVT